VGVDGEARLLPPHLATTTAKPEKPVPSQSSDPDSLQKAILKGRKMRLDFKKLVKVSDKQDQESTAEVASTPGLPGFNQLYEAYLKALRGEYYWDLDALIFLTTGALAFIPLLIWIILQRPSFIYFILVLIFLVVAAIVVCYLALIVQLTLGSSYNNPSGRALTIAARLLVLEKRPYTSKYGLVYPDFQRLQKIVDIEQQAETWQGNFIQLVMIGTLAVAVWLPATWWHAISLAPGQPGGTFLFTLIHAIPTFFQALILLAFGAGITALLYRWYLYFREFLSTALSNRILLRACEEALALMENLRLHSSSEFSIREKKVLAEYLGCQLIAWERATPLERSSGAAFTESAGEKWLLVYPADQPRSAPFSQWRRKIQAARIFPRKSQKTKIVADKKEDPASN
jgi:hypothetical protein